MRRWTAAGDKITRRTSSEIVDALPAGPTPFDFVAYQSPTTSVLQSLALDSSQGPDAVLSFPSKSLAYLGDTLVADSKFFHVLDCARASIERNAVTWGTVDGYHAALLGGRAILAHFGVLPYTVGGRSCLVDFFPELGPPDHTKRFKKECGSIVDPVRVLRPTADQLLDQNNLWKLVIRIVNVAKFSTTTEEAILLRLKEAIGNAPWKTRHQVLYDTPYWQWRADIDLPSLTTQQKDDMLRVEDTDVAEFVAFLDDIYSLVWAYEADLSARTSVGSLKIPAGIKACAVPNVLV